MSKSYTGLHRCPRCGIQRTLTTGSLQAVTRDCRKCANRAAAGQRKTVKRKGKVA